MVEKDGACIWSPNETVYSAGEISKEAFLVVDGSVKILSVDNLLLNKLGPDEIFGETSSFWMSAGQSMLWPGQLA